MNYLEPLLNQNLRDFVQMWYGPPTSPNAALNPSPAPRELVEWHHISTQWDGIITSQNYAIPLSEVSTRKGEVPFWVESQGSRVWAFDPTGRSHFVYERDPSSQRNPWTPTGESLSTFLIHATAIEAIFGAPAMKVAQGIDTDWIFSQAHELPFPSWSWPTLDSRVFASEKWLALAHASDSEGKSDLMLAATTPEHLTWVQNTPSIKWRSYVTPQQSMAPEAPPW
ncbi:hypothetical protein ACGGAI_09735 [Streptomyces antibioticus]|uniref:hypothetical protein n=1 Tax=Streptomyces antibioticus TaxID=1890 RepID=UPI00371FFE5B